MEGMRYMITHTGNSKTGFALVRVVAIFIMIPLCLDRRFVSPSNFNKKEEVHGKITHF